ncbi:MAG: UDP-N-acetylglucosamine 2-epimerase (non-hydrolyzing) [Dokdonella sp.]
MPDAFVRLRILAIVGTRPECLKLASPVRALRQWPEFEVIVLGSGQHAGMVSQTAHQIGLPVDVALSPLLGTSLTRNVATLRQRIGEVARERKIDYILVQGDTATAYAGALAARDLGLPLAHVEAGLRSSSLRDPFPEEWFRRRISRIATSHFAPTRIAADNLRRESIAESSIHETGNTIIDLLRVAVEAAPDQQLDFLPPCDEFAVLTLHRRNNQGAVTTSLCESLLDLLERHPTLGVVCPLHPNPAASEPIRQVLGGHHRVSLTPPLDYFRFIALLARARLAISDSGGLQEETPYLGTPLIITRAGTERPEALLSGRHVLLPHGEGLVDAVETILSRPRPVPCDFDADAPYGDGHAGERIARRIHAELFPVRPRGLAPSHISSLA